MAILEPNFIHGKNSCVYVNGFNLSIFFRSTEFGRTKETVDATTFRSRAKRFVGGFPDASVSAEGLWDDQAGAIDEVLDASIAGDALSNWIWFPGGDGGAQAVGATGYAALTIDTNHSVSGSVDDVVATAVEAQPTTGRERVKALYGLGDLLLAASPFTSSSLDSNIVGGTALGGAGYLQVMEIDGTGSLDIEIHMSDDDFSVDDDTLITFTTQTATSGVITTVPHERIVLALDAQVDQFLNIEVTMTTITRALFVVAFFREVVVAT